MTKQAENCLALFKGASTASIKQALKIQRPSIVEELKEHFGTRDIESLAVRLSRGY